MESTVASYLTTEFEEVAHSLLERTTGTSQDGGSSGQETARYDKLMRSLRLVGERDAITIFASIWKWRKHRLYARDGYSEIHEMNVVIDSTFLEASVQLLEDKPYNCQSVLQKYTEEMEYVAFRWAQKIEQVKISPKMTQFCRNIEDAVARIIGALAKGRLESVSMIFFKEISSLTIRTETNSRPAFISLCNAMKYIKLSFSSANDFAASLNLIGHSDPLKHTAAFKPSQARHCLSKMMSCWLHPIAVSGVITSPPFSADSGNEDPEMRVLESLRNQFFSQINTMQENLRQWAEEKNKHIPDVYPLIVDLWCLQKRKNFLEKGDKVLKMLKKAMKMKDYRCLAVRCITQCGKIAIYRFSSHQEPETKTKIFDWMNRILRDVNFNIKKTVNPSGELQDLMVRLCITIFHYRPSFVADFLLLPLMKQEQSDKVPIALRALLELMFMFVAKLNNSTSGKELPVVRAQLVSLERNDRELRLLEYIRSGKHALNLVNLEERSTQFSKELGNFLRALDPVMASSLNLTKASTSNENTKDLVPMPTVLAWCIRCIPYILPYNFRSTELIETLARYTCNEERMISSVAIRSLKHTIIGIPSWRSDVLSGLASCIVNIPDEKTSAIIDGLWNLHGLLLEWSAYANEPMEIEHHSPGDVFKVQPLEGIVLCFVCSACSEIRKLAIEILSTIRSLHKSLLRTQQESLHLHPGPEMESPFSSVMYVMDVLDEMGNDIAQRVYWDIGQWSDLWRRWKQVPEHISLFDVMCGSHERDFMTVRWARCLSEIAIEAHGLCSEAFERAYVEVSKKIQQITKPESLGKNSVETTDPVVIDRFRNYFSFACGCPPYRKTNGYSVNALHQQLVHLLSNGASYFQEIAVLALGNCNPKSYDVLANKLQSIMNSDQVKEKSRSKQTGKTRIEEIRLRTANIYRLIADRMPRGSLSTKRALTQRILESIDLSLTYVQSFGPGSFFESISPLSTDSAIHDTLEHCYCLCSTVANAATELANGKNSSLEMWNLKLRRILFETFQKWNAPGTPMDEYFSSKATLLHSVATRNKDIDSLGKSKSELDRACEVLEVMSRLAMISLLEGPPWESDRRTNSPIFTWVEYLLTTEEAHNMIGPSNSSIGRQALLKLILSNPSVFPGYVDKCYYENQKVASIYFQVVCEVYCSYEVDGEAHVIVCLVLFKCVDPDRQVREDALHLLKCLAHREWQGKCTTGWALCFTNHSMEDNVVVIGNLQDTCQSFQYQLSECLAREHPEITEKLCEELMTNQVNEVVNQGVLLCLTPWMERLSFCPGDTEWGERLLKSMYYITKQHGQRFAHETERLWSTIVKNNSNIRPVLEFLVGLGVNECTLENAEVLIQYFSVLKRISLYLARTSPHRTIDYLVVEAGRMIQSTSQTVSDEDRQDSLRPLKFSSSYGVKPIPHLKTELSFSSLRDGITSISTNIQPSISAFSLNNATTRVPDSSNRRIPSFTSGNFGDPISSSASAMIMMTPSRDRNYASNVSVSMQSDGSFDESTSLKPDLGVNHSSRKSISNLSALGSDRRGSEVIVPSLKGCLHRSDIALCLLSEIAFEQGDKFNNHVPLLFHLCVICMDSLEPVLRLHCQQLVIHLLHVLMSKRVGVPGKVSKLSALMSALQSMKGQSPWPYEDTDLTEGRVLSEDNVIFFVSGLLEAASQGSNLKDLWIKEALTWAVECSNRHLSCRSFQVLRGLNPQASSEAFISMVRCLEECFVSPSLTAMECVLEILETMKMLMYNAEATKLVLYPQLFWVCISLLSSDYIHIYCLALELLYRLLESLSISNDIILNVLLATTPLNIKTSIEAQSAEEEGSDTQKEIQPWDLGTQILLPITKGLDNPILCVQHLLIKGLYSDETELITTKLLTRLASELTLTPYSNIASLMESGEFQLKENLGVSTVLGKIKVQIAVSLAAIIPWTCLKILTNSKTEAVLELCYASSEACNSEGFHTVGSSLSDLMQADHRDLQEALNRLANAFYEELPHEMECLMIGYWLGSLKGSKEQGKIQISLFILRAIFERCKNHSTLDARLPTPPWLCVLVDFDVFSIISAHLQGSNAIEASKVLSAMVSLCPSPPSLTEASDCDEKERKKWVYAMKLGMDLHRLVPPDHDHTKLTIHGVLETCPQHLKKASGRDFMPFLK